VQTAGRNSAAVVLKLKHLARQRRKIHRCMIAVIQNSLGGIAIARRIDQLPGFLRAQAKPAHAPEHILFARAAPRRSH
jgi:hypothetical protein